MYLAESGGIDDTELALDLAKGVPMASLCLALLAKVLPNKPGDLERPWVLSRIINYSNVNKTNLL